jgi:ribonucleoside-triphosphate reductase
LKVRTSHDTIEDFNRSKIVRALVNEANAPIAIAEKIAAEVESYLKRIDISPTTTMIREMVNAKLVEYGFDDIAASHQRLGLPVYDVGKILTRGDRMDSSTQFNPESIHKHMGDMIARNFALESVIPPELADAHRRGLIHIHELEYFVTRPYCFVHDLRYFLRRGLRVDGSGRDTAVAGPAKHAEVAVFHAAKALAASQVFWSGGQAYNFFNIFMAPYFAGKGEKETSQLCQLFIYEMSQQYVARGGQMVLSSISLTPEIPEVLSEAQAVKPGGILGPETYSDYHDESLRILRGMIGVLKDGDFLGKPFPFPQVEVKLEPHAVKRAEEEYLAVCELAAKFGSPVFLNTFMDGIEPGNCSVESAMIVDTGTDSPSSLRGGVLQVVTINLPRIAFESRGREGRLLDLLSERVDLAARVLLLKREIIRARMREGSLAFAAQQDNGSPYLRLDDQGLYFGIVGVNEVVKSLTGQELHESREARGLARRVLKRINEHAADRSGETGLKFGVCQSPTMEAGHRLATIDRRQFRGRFISEGDAESGSLHYTAGAQLRSSARVSLSRRLSAEGPLHKMMSGGSLFEVWLAGVPPAEEVWDRAQSMAKAPVGLFAFTQDLTICLSCGSLMTGLGERCQECASLEIDWISRSGGGISRVGVGERIGGWNLGAREQLLNRRRTSR